MGRGRAPCCDKAGLKKGPWTPAEDLRLMAFIQKHGHGNWRALPKIAGLLRCGKSCRLRWTNYLRPDIKRGNFTQEEEDTIIKLHQMLGNKWSKIASTLPGRTDNEIKNVWNTHLKKRSLALEGQYPSENEPKDVSLTTSSSSSTSSISDCNQVLGITSESNGHNLSVSESSTEALEKKHEPKELLRSPSLSSFTSSILDSKQVDGFRVEEQTCPPPRSGELFEVQDLLQDVSKQDIQDKILEIPYEPYPDLWDMLEDHTSFSTSSAVPVYENDQVHQHSDIVGENLLVKDLESMSWVTNLENELGLQATNYDDAVEPLLSNPSSEEFLVKARNDPILTYFQRWPSSPLNYNL